ncbi:nitrate regulatory gene2 protein-like [Cynara cardunculus var. scolymus]|uniref:nitrate regulatory gene2 protein-like n=1 Tax=Cynara cardunculus var. scolymus TaxID=59895 RepID=UPI000D62957A|nr:nitrate regulatory gene2 protein-like [Cynara cardunculus var. scolymus]
MGCTQSKIENEEIVNRCKERKTVMKESVSSRNAFAAAHFSYAAALKNTGAALSDYAQGEVQFPDNHHPSSVDAVSSSTTILPPAPPQPPYESLLPPPPPPLERAATMPEFSIEPEFKSHPDPIKEEGDEVDEIDDRGLKHRSSSRGRNVGSKREMEKEDLPPPSPPQPAPRQSESNLNRAASPPPLPNVMSWDFFFPSMENVIGPSLAEVDNGSRRFEREEIHRKEMEEEEKEKHRSMNHKHMDGHGDGDGRSGDGGDKGVEDVAAEVVEEPPPPPPKVVKKARVPVPAPAEVRRSSGKGGGQSLNLLQIFTQLDDFFLKASESANEVSKMLEANRLHYHSNFADNRGHIDHSARVMRVITWNRSFKGFPEATDDKDDFDSEENETHATVLDKMLAWEKKLYDEVKAGELMKLEYQKKIASLNKLKKRGASTDHLERTKATVSHLHTRYIVDMQSMDSTVSEINRLRDEQLYPKLVQLVEGMAVMWESMRIQHDNQSKIVQALRSLDISHSPKETSEHHYKNTRQLNVYVEVWHGQFEKLMLHQKEYVKSLNNWLKLNLIPIDNNLREKVSSPQRPQNPPILSLLRTWHDFLEKLPEEGARTAIHNFAAVMDTIFQYQTDEMKMKERCEETRRELTRKQRKFEDWYNKYIERRTSDDMENDKDVIADQQITVEALKHRLEEEEEGYQRQCIQVRDKSLMNLKTGLPEVFRAMSEFSRACSHMYRNLKSHSRPQYSNTSLS